MSLLPDIRRRCRRALLLLAAGIGCCGSALGFEMEMGQVTVQDTFSVPSWTSVSFSQPFQVAPLVFALPTTDGGDPATLRIRNVTTTGFEIVQTEPSGNDGPHVAMPTAYLAIEPGDHVFPDGTRITAQEHLTTSFANRFLSTTWDLVAFPSAFGAQPAVLAGIQTVNNEIQNPPVNQSVPFMDVGIRNVGTASAQVTLERAESVAGTVSSPERIAILAIDAGVNLSFVDALGNAVQLQSLLTAANIQGYSNGCFTNNYAATFPGTPLAVASQNTRFGNNGSWLRRCSQSSSAIGLTADEDIDSDSERNHIGEAAGVVAASVAFHAVFEPDLSVQKNSSALSDPINGGTGAKRIPQGTISYSIEVENRGSGSPDNNSLVVTDDIPPELSLCVTSTCLAGGPVVLDPSASPVPPGIALGAIEYSNNGGVSYTYSPVPDADGFDAAVDAIRITLSGTMAPVATAGPPSFELQLAARIN